MSGARTSLPGACPLQQPARRVYASCRLLNPLPMGLAVLAGSAGVLPAARPLRPRMITGARGLARQVVGRFAPVSCFVPSRPRWGSGES